MNEDEVREAIEVLREIDPEKAEKLAQHVHEDPHRVGQALHEHFPNLGRFLAMRRHDPQMFELRIDDLRLNHQAHEIARRVHEAEASQDDMLAAAEGVRLEQIVVEHFEVRQQIRERELMKLQQRIEQMRDQLEQRAADRDALITERLDELTGEDAGNSW